MPVKQPHAVTNRHNTAFVIAIILFSTGVCAFGCAQLKNAGTRPGMVVALTWIPNTNHFISAFENSLDVFDANNFATPLQQTAGEKSEMLTDVDASSDGKYAATSSLSGDVIVYKIDGGVIGPEVTKFKHHGGALSVHFSPDCKKIASSGRDGIVQVRMTDDFESILEIEHGNNWIECTAFSGDSKLLATGSWGGQVRLFDVETGKEMLSFQSDNNAVLSLAFLNDDKVLIVATQGDSPLKVHDAHSGTVLKSIDSECSIRHVVAKDDTIFYSCGNDGSVRLWNCLSGRELGVFLSSAGWRTAICVSNNKQLAIAGNIEGELEAIRWERMNKGTEGATHE